MKVWAIANQKGGVGKTTTTVTLAGLLAARGERTLMVDLDPHGSLTAYFRLDPDALEDSGYLLFQNPAMPDDLPRRIIRDTGIPNLSLLPAATAMATLDRQLGAREGMGLVLARALARVFEQYDYVLLDCSPTLGVLMVNALGACEQLIIPVQTEYLAVQGLERMLHTLAMITRARKTPLKYCIVPTMYDRRTHVSQETLTTMQQKYAASLWDGVIPIDSQLRQAAQDGTPLSTHHRSARSVQAYDRLLDHLLGLPVAEAPPLPAVNHA